VGLWWVALLAAPEIRYRTPQVRIGANFLVLQLVSHQTNEPGAVPGKLFSYSSVHPF
jgi:hypothetical protein